jgi:acyl carrier protein
MDNPENTNAEWASIRERVIRIIANQFGREPQTISDSTDIANDLGADGLEFAELCLAWQEEFNIDIDCSGEQNVATVGDVVEIIHHAKITGNQQILLCTGLPFPDMKQGCCMC